MTKPTLDSDPGDIVCEYDRADLDGLSDPQVFDLAARIVSVPHERPANSFASLAAWWATTSHDTRTFE